MLIFVSHILARHMGLLTSSASELIRHLDCDVERLRLGLREAVGAGNIVRDREVLDSC